MQGVLFDLDGVLYNAGRVIPGAAETVAWAREQGIAHLFVTNTTSRPRLALVEKLARFGIDADAAQIHTPAMAATAWLHSQRPGKIALFVRETVRAEFAGLPLLPANVEQGASYVVIGDLGEGWNFLTLNRAFRLLHHNPEAVLIALGMTRYWQAADGVSLDVAPFVAALEHASGRRAVVLGKPARSFFLAAVERLGLHPSEVVMVGDDARADVEGAQAAGLRGVLVKTGKFRTADIVGEARPDGTIDSIAELPQWWLSRH